ncbi:MAG: hypothetical protein Q7U82_12760, partial [Gammaproteobacteria bacterium]|nr:hypothetical protein [Gammaproteobacteria bacterium]
IPLFTTLVLTLSSQILLAQPGAGAGGGGGGMGMGNPEARVTELIATLEITSQQEAAFREAMGKINEMQMSAMREMMGSGGGGGGMRMGAGQGAMPQSGQAAAPADAPVDHSQHGGAPATGDQAAAAGDHANHGAAATTDAPAAAGGGMRMGAGQGGGMAMNMERRAEMQRQAEELLAPVLTETQMVKYREAEEARMTQMRERMMQRGQ